MLGFNYWLGLVNIPSPGPFREQTMTKLQVIASILMLIVICFVNSANNFSEKIKERNQLRMQQIEKRQQHIEKECKLMWPIGGDNYEDCIKWEIK